MSPDSEWRSRLAWWMDEAFSVPGTRIRFGLDAILGLIPGGGDFATGLVQTALVLSVLYSENIPFSVAVRMVANVAIDTALGSIPILGDAFDVFFKANTRNVQLLRRVEDERRRTGAVSGRRHVFWLFGLGVLLVTTFLGFSVLALLIARALWGVITGTPAP